MKGLGNYELIENLKATYGEQHGLNNFHRPRR